MSVRTKALLPIVALACLLAAGGARAAGRLVTLSTDGNSEVRGVGSARDTGFGRATEVGFLYQVRATSPDPSLHDVVGVPGKRDGEAIVYTGPSFSYTEPAYRLRGKKLGVSGLGQAILFLDRFEFDQPPKWAVGAPGEGEGAGPPASVLVFEASMEGMKEIYRLESEPGSRFGWSMAVLRAGESGRDVLVIGAPGRARNRRRPATGAIYAFRESGEAMWSVEGRKKGEFLGYSVTALPDRDFDGIGEVLVGIPGRKSGRGEARVYSGRTGRLLRRLVAPAGAGLFGFDVQITGDFDADGNSDLLVGAPRSGQGERGAAYLLTADGEELWSRHGTVAGQWFGVDVRALARQQGLPPELVGVASALFDSSDGESGRGAFEVFAIDDSSGQPLARFEGSDGGEFLGWPIHNCGSVACLVSAGAEPAGFLPLLESPDLLTRAPGERP